MQRIQFACLDSKPRYQEGIWSSVSCLYLWRITCTGTNEPTIALLIELYYCQTGDTSESKTFSIRRGVRQGDIISSILFNAVLEHAFRKWKARLQDHGWLLDNSISERNTNIRYADDMMLFANLLLNLKTCWHCWRRNWRILVLKGMSPRQRSWHHSMRRTLISLM